MKKYDVQCPHCCGTFHETTPFFKLGVPVKGHMLTSKPHVKDAAWSTFPEYDSTEYQDIICPSCSQAYLNSLGMVIRLVETGEWPEPELPRIKTAAELMDEAMAEYEPEVPNHPTYNAVDEANAPKEAPKKKPGRPKK
jgi:hypothetical protein